MVEPLETHQTFGERLDGYKTYLTAIGFAILAAYKVWRGHWEDGIELMLVALATASLRHAIARKVIARKGRPSWKIMIDSADNVDESIQWLANASRIAAPSQRLRILCMLEPGDQSAHSLCDEFKISGPGLSNAVAHLKAAGLIDRWREGHRAFFGLTAKGKALMAVVRSLSALMERSEKS